ncbi:hypothetical protein JTB14_008493 [Gonioctena quinquepunctata]|nr:hypothetical protein JTB14_008493 [Gonioctena quinquepunctata]
MTSTETQSTSCSNSKLRRSSITVEVDMGTTIQSRFAEMINFINNDMDTSKRLTKAGREGLIERVQHWGLEQANLEGRIQGLKEENERLRKEVKQTEQRQNEQRPMPVSYAAVASRPMVKLTERDKIIEKTRQNPEHILFVTSDKINNGRKVQDEVTKILDPRTQILEIK